MLILLRHGQTEANASGLLLGRADPELTQRGESQAAAAAGSLAAAGIRPVRVVASPLRRAVRTAQCFGVPVDVDDRWVELDYGEYDQRPMGDVPGEVWDRWRSDPSFRPPGGESLEEVAARVREACESLAGEAAASDVVVVSHVSPIKAAVAWALGVGPQVAWRMFLDVAAITTVTIGPRGPSLRSFNQVGHLDRLVPAEGAPPS